MSVVKEFVDVIRSADKKGTTPYDTQATVTRVEGNTAWVHIPGGVDETPIKMTVSAKAGDVVQVRVSGGTAWLTGNATAPPTDDTQAIKATETAVKAVKKAEQTAQETDAVQAIAKATNQHFWQRSTDPDSDGAGTGAFVTDEEQDTFLDAMKNDVQPTTARPLHNLLMNAEGILLRAAKRIRAAFTPSGVAFYDGQGNNSSNIVAAFGTSGAQIGASEGAHTIIDNDGMEVYARNGTTQIAVLGYGTVKSQTGTTTAPYTSLGQRSSGSTIGMYSTAEGSGNTASGPYSHAEGNGTIASGSQSHAEGIGTSAGGDRSHAEGWATKTTGGTSHAEGYYSEANGHRSHAQNEWTIANGDNQTTIGKYNIADTNSAFIIGNGSGDGNRSNAFRVDWSGNVVAAGTVKTGKSSSSVSFSSSVTSTTVNNLNHNGSVAGFYIGFHLKSSFANNDTLTVGTVPTGYRPAHTMALSVYVSAQAIGGICGYVNASGDIVIRNISGAAISNTSATIYVGATYLL